MPEAPNPKSSPARPVRTRQRVQREAIRDESEVRPGIVVYVTEVNMNIGLPMFGTVVFPAVHRLRERITRLLAQHAEEDGGPIAHDEDKAAA